MSAVVFFCSDKVKKKSCVPEKKKKKVNACRIAHGDVLKYCYHKIREKKWWEPWQLKKKERERNVLLDLFLFYFLC